MAERGFYPRWVSVLAFLVAAFALYQYLNFKPMVYEVSPVRSPQYLSYCGECHFAYPAGLAGSEAWSQVMGRLDTHFGEELDLPGEVRQVISDYLLNNSADHEQGSLARRINRSPGKLNGEKPISASTWFLHQHHEVPSEWVEGNPQVRSFGACDRCHRRAAQGRFQKRNVQVPGISIGVNR